MSQKNVRFMVVLVVLVVLSTLLGACGQPPTVEDGVAASEAMAANNAAKTCEDAFTGLLNGEAILRQAVQTLETGVCTQDDPAFVEAWQKGLEKADLPSTMTVEEYKASK